MRFPDFLRAATLLFGGSASALAVVAVVGAGGRGDTGLVIFAAAWWSLAAAIGTWLGRRLRASNGISRLMASARHSPALPELEPGTILFNRLWGLAAYTLLAGGVGFVLPQIPAIAAGYPLLVALLWRKQAAAVSAVEGRDGVRFYVERTSPFRATRLLRTPGFRRFEAAGEPTEAQTSAAVDARLRMASSSSHGLVLATSRASAHARRAVATP